MACPDRLGSYSVVGYVEKKVVRRDGSGFCQVVVAALPVVGVSEDFRPPVAWVPAERGDKAVFHEFNGGEARVGETGLEEVPVPLADGAKLVR